MIQLNDKQYHCNIEVIVDVIGGKWKMLILWNLKETSNDSMNYAGSFRESLRNADGPTPRTRARRKSF